MPPYAPFPPAETPTDLAAPPPINRWWVVLLCVLWLVAGTIGHDPWKPNDAINLGIAFDMSSRQHWIVPHIAGDPWPASPPLYFWVAAACGQLFQWFLPWHEAARLATTLFGAGFLWTLAASVRHLAGSSAALVAPLLAIGTLGLLLPLHDAQPAIVGLLSFSLTLLALLKWRTTPRLGGILLGLGIGISFLGAGIDLAILSAVTALLTLTLDSLAHLNHSAQPPAARLNLAAAGLAIVTASVLILPWPYLLYQESPALLDWWWAIEKLSLLPGASWFSRTHFKLLLWASWPLLPLAIWHVWLERHRLLSPKTALPLLACLLSLLMFFVGSPRPESLLPALVPLAMLATQGAGRLRRGAANAFDWFGMITFSLIHALLWLGAISLLTGTPAKIAKNFTKPAPGFIPDTPLAILALAIALTLGWLVFTLSLRRTPWRAATRWSIGWAGVWLLITALWLPWIDYGKSYRLASADFSPYLGNHPGCIARRNLGLAQRASLDYFNGIRTISEKNGKACEFLIAQTSPRAEKSLPGWQLLKETSRPGDKSERLRLYRRLDPESVTP